MQGATVGRVVALIIWSAPEDAISPTSDPITVNKEGEDSFEEEEYTPDPDDFPGTLYDLLDEVDDVIEVSWTKSPSVTKNKNIFSPATSSIGNLTITP